jgi:hypothetical protein
MQSIPYYLKTPHPIIYLQCEGSVQILTVPLSYPIYFFFFFTPLTLFFYS